MTIKEEEDKESFYLPIHFLQDKCELEKNIITDLELKETANNKSLYDYVFLSQDKNSFGKKTIDLWSRYYTANKAFIRDSQKLLQTDININGKDLNETKAIKTKAIFDIWQEIQEETGFIYKYQYIEYERFEHYNNNPVFLQCLSIFNMTSPVLSLLVPIFLLLIPLILLKFKGIPLTGAMYMTTLKTVFQRHHIGQLFTLNNASIDRIVYILLSFAFYLFQIYQNIMACIKFFKNMHKIHNQLFIIRDYLRETLEKMDLLEKNCRDLKTYQPFIQDMNQKRKCIEEMLHEYNQIIPFTSLFSMKKVGQIGHVMKCFYQLYNKTEYHAVLQYTFGLNGYLENLDGLQLNIKQNNVGLWHEKKDKNKKDKNKNKEKDHKNTADAIFKQAYFPTLVNTNPVKNDYELKKHMIITGPNAAGKTTLLKTTLFNIILSQQCGYGFYEKAEFVPYDQIHCYINIPDTSGRDSLFQAEARRCKEILDDIGLNKVENKRHFCVFDELYSGTNPYEAVGSAYAFLTYLNTYNNVNFVLTTHFLDLCKRFSEETMINNYHMRINADDPNNFKYTYELSKGISSIKGGVKVLKDLQYPNEIIMDMQKVLETAGG